MKKYLHRFCLTALSLLLVGQANAQCTARITTTGVCPPAVLTANAGFKIQHIDWKLNNNIIKSVDTAWQANGVTVAGGSYGQASNQLENPSGVFVDDSNNMYVMDQSNNRVMKWAPGASSGIVVAGGNGWGYNSNQIGTGVALFVDNNHNVYVADADLGCVTKWAPGVDTCVIVSDFSYSYGAGTGMWIDNAGNIYITDANDNSSVVKWAPGATASVTVAGGNGFGCDSTHLGVPVGVSVDASGKVYVADYSCGVSEWAAGDTTGTALQGVYGSGYMGGSVSGIWVDNNLDIYVLTDFGVRLWPAGDDSVGIPIAAGTSGGAANQLNYAQGICVDAAGNVYVGDGGNSRVQRFSPIDDTILVTQPGTYTATITGFNGCVVTTDSIVINPSPQAAILASGPTILCPESGASVTLNANTGTNLTYQWLRNNAVITGATDSSYLALGTYGYFKVVVTDSATTCATTSNQINVTALPPASVAASGPIRFCAGNNVTLMADSATGLTYQWQKNNINIAGATNYAYTADSSGNYTVFLTYTGSTGTCSITSYPTSVLAKPNPVLTVTSSSLCPASTLKVTSQIPMERILWKLNGNTIDTVNSAWAVDATTVAGGNGSGTASNQINGQLDKMGIFIDANGNVYVADQSNNRVQEWPVGAAGGITVAGGNGAGTASNQLNNPSDVYVDNAGNVYVADMYNNRIQLWAPGATAGVTVAGGNNYGAGANQLSQPIKLWVDGSGNIYIADYGNQRIQKWAPGASAGVTVAGGNGVGYEPNQVWNARGMWLDDSNNLYTVADQSNIISKWAPGATSGTILASSGQSVAYYDDPTEVCTSGNGENVFVLQFGGNKVQQLAPNAPNGIGNTVVGGGGGYNGGGADSLLDWPNSLSIDYNGNLFVGDNGNARVQKFAPMIVDTFVAGAMGSYTALVTSFDGCSTVSDTAFATPRAVITTNGQPTLCAGSSITLQVDTAQGYVYQWEKNGTPINDVTNSYTATTAGIYSILVSYDTCSVLSQPDTIVVHPLPPVPVVTTNGAVLSTTQFATYQWALNGTAIPGATSMNYTATQSGIYTVSITDSNGCSNTSQPDSVTLGIADITNGTDNITIYPNPANSKVYIDAPFKINVTVSGMDGKLILQQNDAKSIDLNKLADGLYMIRVTDVNGVLMKVQKLVKM